MKVWEIVFLALCWGTALLGGNAIAAHGANFGITMPSTNHGEKWRIAYYEGGPHENYYDYLMATAQGLMELGWIEEAPIPESRAKDSMALWNWLSREAESNYLEFVSDAYYCAGWDDTSRAELSRRIFDRLSNRPDIDLILALGTWAGKDLASNKHSTPTIVMSASDPVGAGIIESVSDSGYDHVHARVDPRRYERQVSVFHDVVAFKKLGVAYEDSPYGRTYAAIDPIEKAAKQRGFEIERCHTKSDIADQSEAGESVIACFEKLSRSADAIYVTVQGGVNAQSIPALVSIANERRVPTFSQLGSNEVRYGFLMSLSRRSFSSVGRFHAMTIAQIFNGAKPRQLPQLFEEMPNIAINLKTAEMVGLYLYADVLAAADEIYRRIETPQ